MIFNLDILRRLEDSAFLRKLFGLLPRSIQRLLDSRRNFLYALLVHIFFLSVLVVSYDWSAIPAPGKPKVNIIDAVVIDESRVQAEIDKLKKTEAERKQSDADRQRKLKAEEKKLADLKRKKQQEQQKLAEQKKKRLAEEKQAKDMAAKKQAEAAKLKKLKQEQAALEQKRVAEQQRLADLEQQRQQREAEQLKKQQEQQAKLEAERQQKLKQEQQRKEAEHALQEQLAAEQVTLEAERQRQSNRVVDQYVAIITQKVQRNWLRPPTSMQGLSCVVAVSLIPGGEVVKAQVTRGSGDPVFDRSVESAVLKASPLPLPADAALFERFRELEFVFKPEG